MFRKLVTAFVLASSFLALALISQADAAYVGTRRALLTGPCPQQTKVNGTCNSFTADFRSGTYYALGIGYVSLSSWLSDTRASPKLCQFVNGTWTSVGNNTLCVTDQGALIEEARTNKCTNYNANPPALVAMGTAAAFNAAVTNMVAAAGSGSPLFGVADQSATLANSIGLNVVNGRVYHIDNTSGTAASTVLVGGTTGNTNAHSLSVYMWGSGQARVRASSFAPSYVSISATPTRYTNANFTPTNSSVSLIVDANTGADVYFILADMEEGSFVTSPIITAGASATRAADVPQMIGPAATAALAAKSMFIQTTSATYNSAAVNRFFAWDTAAAAGNMNMGGTTVVQATNPPNNASATIGGGGTVSGTVKAAYGFDATSFTAVANGGSKVTSNNAWATGTTPYLGNRSVGDRALNGYMQRFALSPIKGVFDGATAP